MKQRWSVLILGLILTGCSSVPWSEDQQPSMAIPLQSTVQDQWSVFQLGHLLSQKNLSMEDKARLLYERGQIWDRMGLSALALIDFNRSLQLQPSVADVHFSLGLYLLQQGKIRQSYEEFDAAIELNPDDLEAYLQRGVALYYGNRSELAVRDFAHLQGEEFNYPEVALWRYFVRQQHEPELARSQLRDWVAHAGDEWPAVMGLYYLGQMGEQELLNKALAGIQSNSALAERLCDLYFYLAKYSQLMHQESQAYYYFKLALAQNSYGQPTHRYAALELSLWQSPE